MCVLWESKITQPINVFLNKFVLPSTFSNTLAVHLPIKVWSGKKTQQVNPDWDSVERKLWEIWGGVDLQ